MKKIWYIEDVNRGIKRIAKLIIYEKNREHVAQLDLKSFADFPITAQWEICFFHKKEGIIEVIKCEKYKDFLQKALSGHGMLPMVDPNRLCGVQNELEIVIVINGVYYSSDKNVDISKFPKLHAEEDNLQVIEVDVGQDSLKKASSSDNLIQEQQELDAENPDEDCAEALHQGYRKVIALSVLEDEMLFRTYLHNSFLLHGYYNYGHLVLDEDNNRCRLGVPGNYYEREQMVATMFGFPEFEPAKDEKVQSGTFGYFFTRG